MSDLLRDRVQAIQKLAEAATEGPWGAETYEVRMDNRHSYLLRTIGAPGIKLRMTAFAEDVAFVAAARTEVPWLAAALLEALDTIDKARQLHSPREWALMNGSGSYQRCDACLKVWPCPTWQALNGGNEAEDDR
jgi:hypothetical protein